MASIRRFANGIVCEMSVFGNCHGLSPKLSFLRSLNSFPTFKFSDMRIEIATEAQKKRKPDPSTLIFGEKFSDHMFEVEWNHRSGWGVPRIVPLHIFQFHPASKVFHYAQAIFEGMKAFKSSEGTVSLFRPDLNIKRLLATAERAALPLFDGDEFLKCLTKLISIEKDWIPGISGSSLYIRPTFIATQSSIGVHPSNSALLYVITCPVGPYFSSGQTKPISLLADPKYVRAWPGGVGDKKMASNYAPTLYVQKAAQDQGFQQVLWLFGDNHQIAEAGVMNVFVLLQKDNDVIELATPALDGTILPGVTRQSIIDLAKQSNEFLVSERSITMEEIIAANQNNKLLEIFVSGTAISVCPVSEIKYLEETIKIPTMNRVNPLYQRLYKALTDIQYGRVRSEWSVKVD